MGTKKKIEIFVQIHDQKDFEHTLRTHAHQLICAEVYSHAFGFCTALDTLFQKIKLDWSDGKIILLKVPADEIHSLRRFRDQSEPVYIFILNQKVTKVFRGMDSIGFGEVVKKELQYHWDQEAGIEVDRHLYELDEPTPDEKEWMARRASEKEEQSVAFAARKVARQTARKHHRAELMVPYLTDLNFVLYWPHCLHAHPELYERWDSNNIVMVAREMIQITDDIVDDVFYAGDAPLNEAALYKLRSGPALALCLRLLEPDQSFAPLVRRILYEDLRLEPHDETKPLERELRMTTAFDYYKTYSPTIEDILKERRIEKDKQREIRKEKRLRKLSVLQRLARQAREEALDEKKKAREARKLELLRSGDLVALEKFKAEPEDNEVDIVIPEEVEDEELSSAEEEDPDEYYPPAGLIIPGFYAPPNDIAKVNGLAVLFPKLVRDRVQPQSEYLPPHVLVMLELHKRYKAIDAIAPYKQAVLHMGIFKATSPYDSVHIANTVKQFESLDKSSLNLDELKIAFMISVECDVPLLQLVELNPVHVSRDNDIGEEECAAMFSVDYCDDYDQYEDF